jgi:hypothetical protein
MNKSNYFNASSRHEKIHITHQVVFVIRQTGRFLKFDKSRQGWVEVPDVIARQKVCQALQYRRRRGSTPVDVAPPPQDNDQRFRAEPQRHQFSSVAEQYACYLQSIGSALRSELQQPVAAAAARGQHDPYGQGAATESNQGEYLEPDSDFLAIIRALSQGAHQQDHLPSDWQGSAPPR